MQHRDVEEILPQVSCSSRWDHRCRLPECRRLYGRSSSPSSPRYRTTSSGSGRVPRSKIYLRTWERLPGGRSRSYSDIPNYAPSFPTADCYPSTKQLITARRPWSCRSSAITMETRRRPVNYFLRFAWNLYAANDKNKYWVNLLPSTLAIEMRF